MREKYSIHKVRYSGQEYHCVYENATCQVLDFYAFPEDAFNLLKELKKGKGFDGFTPAFILNSATVSQTKDINKQFKELFVK